MKKTENKRFKLENEDGTICIRDNIGKKYIFAFICEDIDMEEGMLEECENVVNCLNQTWEMTLRFEKYNKEHIEDNEQLKKENSQLKECNAENSFMIDCFADEEVKLITENEKLKTENDELKQQLADIDRLIDDLGNNEMQRQYEKITKEELEE